MARYNDGTLYNSGARYAAEQPPHKSMSNIATNVSRLTLLQRLNKGTDIITKETANPNVPGNTAVLAAFSDVQTALEEAVATATAARMASKEATSAQAALETLWLEKLTLLASFTETATGGDATKILSAGFDVRGPRTPRPPLSMVEGVIVRLNGTPGHSKLSWNSQAGAEGYLVQGSPDPITSTSWTNSTIVTKTIFSANGATAGQKYWYRVAAFNGAEQGAWSEPAARPVM